VLISPKPEQEGNKLMFLSERRELPSAPCLAGALLEDHRTQTALRLSEMVGYTGVLISPKPEQDGKKLMFLSERRELPSAPCLAGALLEDHWTQTALRLREMVGYTGLLISPKPEQEGNKLMFLSERRELPSAPCLEGALLEDHWAQTLRIREMVSYTGVLISP